jgi:hypothetical protein
MEIIEREQAVKLAPFLDLRLRNGIDLAQRFAEREC